MKEILKMNESCFCGSGKTYAFCHWDATQEKTDKKLCCLHAEASSENCKGKLKKKAEQAKAHTIQRSLLELIAYDVPPSDGTIEPRHPGGKYVYHPRFDELVGISRASRFTGFCAHHDNTTFEPIEKHPFESKGQHAFLLGYRALCYELFRKREAFKIVDNPIALYKDKSVSEQFQLEKQLLMLREGIIASLRELNYHKQEYDEALQKSDFSQIRFYVVKMNLTPPFMCSGGHIPEYDFDGLLLQNLRDTEKILDYIMFSLITTDNGGIAVFSWLGESEAGKRLISSLHSQQDIPHAIVRFTFEYFDNIYADPTWWSSLDQTAQDKLQARQMKELPSWLSPQSQRTSDCLCDEGLRGIVNDWRVVSIETNIGL